MSVIMQPAANLHSPTAIGDIAPNTGAFTALSATGIISGTPKVQFDNGQSIRSAASDLQTSGTLNIGQDLLVAINDGSGKIVFMNGNGQVCSTLIGSSGSQDIIYQRRGTNAQTLAITRSYTDASNYSQVNIAASGSTVSFSVVEAGTGVGTLLRYTVDKPFKFQGYTVATLPAGVVGDNAYVTDALLPSFLTTIAGGGAVVTPVFYNGANWVGA